MGGELALPMETSLAKSQCPKCAAFSSNVSLPAKSAERSSNGRLGSWNGYSKPAAAAPQGTAASTIIIAIIATS